MGEAEEVECGPVRGRMATAVRPLEPEVHKARLDRMESESIPAKTFAQCGECPLGGEVILECHHGVVRVSHQDAPQERLQSARCVRDTASACGSFITGSNVVSSPRRSASGTRHMQSPSTTMWIDACENGSQARLIFTHHPQRKLHEVHYARCVAMPSGMSLPLAFGMYLRREGNAR